jgi:hypothetical protein
MGRATDLRPGFERTFAGAILGDTGALPFGLEAPIPSAVGSRFGVYRNNVILGLTNALAARYPVVRRLLWDDAFNAVARAYVTRHPPQSPVLLEYGQEFPQYLRIIAEASTGNYLADVAELESARVRAYHARDAAAHGRDAFIKFDPTEFAAMRLTLHPSMTLIKSSVPVVGIWESQQPGQSGYVREWKRESALVVRPYLEVEVLRLADGVFDFLKSLADGATVAAAAEYALSADPCFDLADGMTILIAGGLVVGLKPPYQN